MYTKLEEINSRPKPFEFYTAADLWTDEYTSEQMLAYHLNKDVDLSSRNEEFITKSVEWIASHFDVGPRIRIADFGCGPGLYTNRLAKLGARVVGVDFSPRSIAYARGVAADESLAVEYINQNYLDFETQGQFDLVMMIMCDFCALSPSQRMVMLKKFHSLLAPGGAVLLDVYSIGAFEKREETTSYGINLMDRFWSPKKYFCFQNTFKYDEIKVVLDKYTIVEEERVRTVYNWLQYFSPEALEKEFIEAGFALKEKHADVAGSPFDNTGSEFAVVGRKR